MSTHLFRILGSAMVVSTCYWGVYVRPRRQPVVMDDPSAGLSSEEAGRLQDQVNALIHARRYQDALPLAERILKEFPENPIYLRRVAELQNQLGNYPAEAELWERFMKVAPSPGDACPALGDAYRAMGRTRESIGAFERAVALEPHNSEFLFYLGRAYEYGKQYRKALQTYQRTCALNPELSDAIAGWARMEVFIGDPGRALSRLAPLLEKNPDNVDGLLAQGMALRQQGKYAEARVALERGLRLSPTYGDFLLVLAGIAEAEERPAEAVSLYDRYLSRHPEDSETRNRRTRIAAREGK